MGMPRRAVVTGGSGFIGANLVRRLLALGCEVHLLLRPGYADWRLAGLLDRLTLHLLDLAEPAAVARSLRLARPDCIFHLAAHGAYSWQRDAARIIRTNLLATQVLARVALAQGVAVMVQAGTSSEYGRKDHAPAEDAPLEPEGPYAESKAAATAFCQAFAQREGMRLPTLRIYSAYGPWEDPRRLLPALLVHALVGKLPALAAPRTVRDFVAVEDVVQAMLLAATSPLPEPGAVFNLGTGRQTRLEEIVALVRDRMGVAATPRWASMQGREWDTDTWLADSRRIGAALGWAPRIGLADGMMAMADWLRAAPPDLLQRYRAPWHGL